MKFRYMRYTKDNGDVSSRQVVVVSEPRANYLMYDVSKLTDKELSVLARALEDSEGFRDDALQEFGALTGIKLNKLWRSFKPEGIEWIEEDEERTVDKGYN